MNQTLLKDIQAAPVKKIPNIKIGSTVRVHQKIKEGEKERIQVFEGLVIKMNSGHGADKTITVRKVVGGIGVEKVFPVYSKNIAKIEVIRESKIRRAKLYYMRERFGKSARLKGTFVSPEDFEEAVEEAVEAEAEKAEQSEASEETSQEDASVNKEESSTDVPESAGSAESETPEPKTEPEPDKKEE